MELIAASLAAPQADLGPGFCEKFIRTREDRHKDHRRQYARLPSRDRRLKRAMSGCDRDFSKFGRPAGQSDINPINI
jgi:hypothetical protein